MKQSASLGADGQKGAGYLRNSMIVLLVGAFIDLFPLTGLISGTYFIDSTLACI